MHSFKRAQREQTHSNWSIHKSYNTRDNAFNQTLVIYNHSNSVTVINHLLDHNLSSQVPKNTVFLMITTSFLLSLFIPCYESWLSSQPIPLAVIRGFGFQPACISRPGGFGKTSRIFQSNKEERVSVLQICEASKRRSCTQLLWWITKTKSNIKSEGKKKRASWLNESQHSIWCQEDEQLGGTAAWLGCCLSMLLLNFCSLCHFFFSHN